MIVNEVCQRALTPDNRFVSQEAAHLTAAAITAHKQKRLVIGHFAFFVSVPDTF
jgi:hypothetical protein